MCTDSFVVFLLQNITLRKARIEVWALEELGKTVPSTVPETR